MIITNNKFVNAQNMCIAKSAYPSTKIYQTGSATDAIVLKFTDTSYTIKKDDGNNPPSKNPCVGWIQNGCWYYYDNSGNMLKGWQYLSWSQGYNWFYFKSDGCMLANTTQTIKGTSYRFDSDGVCDSSRC